MKSIRNWIAAFAVSIAAGAAMAVGVNGIFDLNRDGTAGIIPSVTADKANFTATKDLAAFDNALLALNGATDNQNLVSDNVARLTKAIKLLAKRAMVDKTTYKDYVTKAVDTIYFQVVGENARGAAAASAYFAGKPVTIANAKRLFATVKATAARQTALEATQGAGKHANWKPLQKLAVYLSACRGAEALIKKYPAI